MKELKALISVYFILISLYSFSQDHGYITGKVIDKEEKLPVPGVIITADSNFVSYSDNKGIFYLPTYLIQKDKEVTFSHLAFQGEKIKLKKKVKDTLFIILRSRQYNLNEVYVYGEKLKSILKTARNIYSENFLPGCYWAQGNYKQLVEINGQLNNYFEADGYLYMRKPSNIGFGSEFCLVPVEMRKIKDKEELSRIFHIKEDIYKKHSYIFTNDFYLYFSFFETIFPLSKRYHNNYSFSFDSLSNKESYLINFKQKGPIYPAPGWKFYGITGQLTLNRTTKEIERISVGYIKSNSSVQLTVGYKTKKNIIFPSYIKMTKVRKTINDSLFDVVASVCKFEVSDFFIQSAECYPEAYYYLLPAIESHFEYHPKYWQNHQADDPIFRKAFQEISAGNFSWDDFTESPFLYPGKEPVKKIKKFSFELLQQAYKDLGQKNSY